MASGRSELKKIKIYHKVHKESTEVTKFLLISQAVKLDSEYFFLQIFKTNIGGAIFGKETTKKYESMANTFEQRNLPE